MEPAKEHADQDHSKSAGTRRSLTKNAAIAIVLILAMAATVFIAYRSIANELEAMSDRAQERGQQEQAEIDAAEAKVAQFAETHDVNLTRADGTGDSIEVLLSDDETGVHECTLYDIDSTLSLMCAPSELVASD